jgi:Caspase domain
MAAANRRRALIVGIDAYENSILSGCVEDAERISELLAKHADGNRNYNTNTILSSHGDVTRATLRSELDAHFSNADGFDLLFYFAGHGAVSNWGPELVTYDYSAPGTGGVSMQEIAALASKSKAREVVTILDCCFSGGFADPVDKPLDTIAEQALVKEDMSIMAASRGSQSAFGTDSGGFFTSALVRGLEGAAADIFGHVTPLGLHEFACRAFEQDLTQQPVLKTYHVHPPVLRQVNPRISRQTLDRLPTLFSDPDAAIAVTADQAVPPGDAPSAEQQDFAALARLAGVGMIDLDGFASLGHAAGEGDVVRLSPLGRYYYELLDQSLLA